MYIFLHPGLSTHFLCIWVVKYHTQVHFTSEASQVYTCQTYRASCVCCVCVRVCACVCIHAYLYRYTYTYIYIYIHVHVSIGRARVADGAYTDVLEVCAAVSGSPLYPPPHMSHVSSSLLNKHPLAQILRHLFWKVCAPVHFLYKSHCIEYSTTIQTLLNYHKNFTQLP